MEFDFIQPLDDEICQFVKGLSPQQLGSKVVFHTKDDFPDLNKIKVAILGVLDNRGDKNKIRVLIYLLSEKNYMVCFPEIGMLL